MPLGIHWGRLGEAQVQDVDIALFRAMFQEADRDALFAARPAMFEPLTIKAPSAPLCPYADGSRSHFDGKHDRTIVSHPAGTRMRRETLPNGGGTVWNCPVCGWSQA